MLECFGRGDLAKAELLARQALAARSDDPLALKVLASAVLGSGRAAEALPLLTRAAARAPQDPQLHNNLGIANSRMLRYDLAAKAFGRAIALAPDDPVVHKNLGVALAHARRLDEAVAELLRAIELYDGDYVEAITVLAACLNDAGRQEEANACLVELVKADPDQAELLYQLVGLDLRRCDWQFFDERLARLREVSDHYRRQPGSPWIALSIPGLGDREHLAIAHARARGEILAGLPEAAPSRPPDFAPGQRRLRIGYISEDLRHHVVGKVIAEVLERHDRTRFEVFGYALRSEDSELRRRLASACDGFVDASAMMVPEIVARIEADSIDLLVDLQGWTGRPRLAIQAMRPAPVRVGWLGYPGSVGHQRLADYLIADPVVAPPMLADCFTETLAYMPHCYLPADTTEAPAAPPSRSSLGLPEDGFVFCSLVSPYKLNPPVFDCWAEILDAVPGSVLWLSDPGELRAGRLRAEAARRGVAPERLVFARKDASYPEHYARLSLADLVLDTWPYNGHSTAIDALWAGVPLVAWLGDSFAGRVGASLLTTAGLPELVAADRDAYRDLAVSLAGDASRRRELRDRVARARSGPLFDMAAFTRSLEALYERMWADSCAGRRVPIGL